MADQPSKQPKSNIDQKEQTVVGSQHNTVYNIIVDPKLPYFVAIGAGIIISTIGLSLGVQVVIGPFTIFLSLVFAIFLLASHLQAMEQARQQRIKQERNTWSTLPFLQLEEKLRQIRFRHRRLIKDTHNGISLTKQKREEWIQCQDDIETLSSYIRARNGNPQPSDYDDIEPPPPPELSRWLLRVRATLSYLLSILFIAAAALIGTVIPGAAERGVRLFFESIPTPTPMPTPTPAPTVLILPSLTPTFTIAPTIQPTATPVLLATATITPTIGNTPIPTNTATATLPPTATTVTPTPSPSPIITATLIRVPRVDFRQSTPATATSTPSPTVTITATPTSSPTVTEIPSATATATLTPTAASIAGLTGYIAYPVFNGARYNTIVRDLSTNTVKYSVANARQPDLRGGGYLLVNREGGSLLRIDINRGDERAITERDEDARPHWAPSDNRFVLESFEPDKNITILKLHLDNTDQSNPPYVRNPNGGTTSGRNALFLADGRIAFNGCASWDAATSGNCGIWTMNTDGKGILQLTDQPHDYPSDNVGSQVLFTSDRDGNWEVYITVNSQPARNLTNHPARDGLATLSPDGNYIAFVSDRGNQWGIWVMRADGSGQPILLIDDITFGTGDHDWTTEKISWGQ